ncbi:MAG TPA: hypothetical protein VFM31_11445 [Nitrososphaeraceae archaeon]|nr:hypothetical protein [Nitrososphaeraceae archaeon]
MSLHSIGTRPPIARRVILLGFLPLSILISEQFGYSRLFSTG